MSFFGFGKPTPSLSNYEQAKETLDNSKSISAELRLKLESKLNDFNKNNNKIDGNKLEMYGIFVSKIIDANKLLEEAENGLPNPVPPVTTGTSTNPSQAGGKRRNATKREKTNHRKSSKKGKK